jgi:addiction module HigA family antidote
MIKMSDLESIDLSDVVDPTGANLPPVHPGDIIKNEFLDELNISAKQLAEAINVPRSRISEIVRRERPVTIDTALRLERYFGVKAETWLRIQMAYDLEIARRPLRDIIAAEIVPHVLAAA